MFSLFEQRKQHFLFSNKESSTLIYHYLYKYSEDIGVKRQTEDLKNTRISCVSMNRFLLQADGLVGLVKRVSDEDTKTRRERDKHPSHDEFRAQVRQRQGGPTGLAEGRVSIPEQSSSPSASSFQQ